MQLHWDIFCRVVDNFGDIGVCWRLARQLSVEHGRQVRLWVDDLPSLKALAPGLNSSADQQFCQGVEVCRWRDNSNFDSPAEVVVEAFACDLPEDYVRLMASVTPKPCWVNLEYLTAETWAEGCHGIASPHPSLPLSKYFFFPGFSAQSGGLLREHNVLFERTQSVLPSHNGEPLEISLFCYDSAPVDQLIDAWANTACPMCCRVTSGKALLAVSDYLGGAGPWRRGSASIEPMPFVPQDDYDRLLRRCSINFVRGEDSLIRALWAGKPFVWQIYQQADDAHLVKLSAFLDRYCDGGDDAAMRAIRQMFLAWNTGTNVGAAWTGFIEHLPAIKRHTQRWTGQLATQTDLATALVNFCASKV